MSDIGSFYFSFSLDSFRMDDIDYVHSLSTVFLYDFFGIGFSVWSASLCGKEDCDVLWIEVFGCEYGEDIFLDDIVGLCIYRNYHDMLEIFSSLCYGGVSAPIMPFETEEFDI